MPQVHSSSAGEPVPAELRPALIALGRSLGTLAVYGKDHPSAKETVTQTFEALQTALKTRPAISLGTLNGGLAVDNEPVQANDVPIRTLEKRLIAMKISHLELTRGIKPEELNDLLSALCAPSEEDMKKTLRAAGTSHIKMSDVKYVAMREGAQGVPADGSAGGMDDLSSSSAVPKIEVHQILAFLKGDPSASASTSSKVKELLSEPEKLGQMILEAASIRQTATSVQDGESMADIVVGCLRRTYGGLRRENEFKTAQGKVNLTKAMMLLEKTVLDKIHSALGAQHPEIDRRIFDAIREMEEEQQFEMLTAHYFEQSRKTRRVEEKIIRQIQKQGAEKTREQFSEMDIAPKDWRRLMVKAGVESSATGTGGPGTGLDMGALAVVLEKMDGLMSIDQQTPGQVAESVNATRNGIKDYTERIESRIQELEGQIELDKNRNLTVEDHAEHLDRETLMFEVSQLTLALLQPLTVVNASIEAAMRHAEKEIQKDLLDLAVESGKRMQSLTQRLMSLVGYPALEHASPLK
jgi:hypothetical protein